MNAKGALLLCLAAAGCADEAAAPWKVEPPRIERTVVVKTIAEAREAVKQAGTKVVFEADLDAAGEDGLVLTANDVLIDGNGKTLANAKRGVASENEVLQRIEVANLALKDCGYGVFLRRDRHVRVHRLTVTGSKSVGIFFENSFGNHGRFFEVHDNRVTGGPKGCIVFQDGCTDGRVYNNVCIDGGYGPQSYANGCLNFDSNIIRVEVYGNRIEGGTFGLAIRGQNNEGLYACLIRENTISKSKSAGLRICYFTFNNVLRDNTVKDCPVAVHYQRAYNVHGNLLDGIAVENCPLAVLVEGANAAPKEGAAPERFTEGNVDRLNLKDHKDGAAVAKVSGGVKIHTLADAGPWKDGVVSVSGGASVVWASFAHVTVREAGRPVAGAEVACGERKALTDEQGLARVGPFAAVEVTEGGAKRVAREYALRVSYSGKEAVSAFTPDGAPVHLSLEVK